MFRGFYTHLQAVGIHQECVTEVEVLNPANGKRIPTQGDFLLIRGKNDMLTAWDGTFLELTRKTH